MALLFALLINQGVVYYVSLFSVGIPFRSPWPVLILTLASIGYVLASAKVSDRFVYFIAAFLTLNFAYSFTSIWVPSVVYAPPKALLTLVVPALCACAGYVVARDNHINLSLFSCAVLATLTGLVFMANGHTPQLFDDDERSSTVLITYHNFGVVMALGSMWAIDRFAKRLPAFDLLSLAGIFFFAYFAFLSGARIVVLIMLSFLLSTIVSRARNLFVSLILVAACLTAVLVISLILRDFAHEIWANPDYPATLRRMVYYAFIKKEAVSLAAADTRDASMRLALEVFLNAPLIGVGWGGYPMAAGYSDAPGHWPHNLLLELLAETGLVGTLAFAVLLGVVVMQFCRRGRRSDQWNLVFGLFIAGLAMSMVGGDWPAQRLLFFAIGAMIGQHPGTKQSGKVLREAVAAS